ncbi:hypothetical protein [Nocardia sp. NPDC060249]|uniref:hypothetical protein n=1 Tax=Nocardia sp. NPDC060249 TaxID=3347082 RepID=UPI0036462764
MNDEQARTILGDTLADNTIPFPGVRALGQAIDWSAVTIADALAHRTHHCDSADQSTLDLLIALDDALDRVGDLTDRLPALASAAMSGAEVAEVLARRTDELRARTAELATARSDFARVAETEAELMAAGAEYERITDRIAELNRLRALAAELPALREQQQALLGKEADLIVATDELERDLASTSTRVLTLAQDQQARLSSHLAELLAQIQAVEIGNAAAANQCAQARAEAQTLRDDHAKRVAELSIHAEISKQLLDQLSGVTDTSALRRVEALVTEAGDLLRRVDSGLGAALRRYDEFRARDHQVLTWGGQD